MVWEGELGISGNDGGYILKVVFGSKPGIDKGYGQPYRKWAHWVGRSGCHSKVAAKVSAELECLWQLNDCEVVGKATGSSFANEQ